MPPGELHLRDCCGILNFISPGKWEEAVDTLEENHISIVKHVKEDCTFNTLKELTRGILDVPQLKALARLLDPTTPKGFQWNHNPAGTQAQPGKRKRGGNGNNARTVSYWGQLASAGVEPLVESTFRFNPELLFAGVPKKGEANYIDDHTRRLFDNLWQLQHTVEPPPDLALHLLASSPLARARSRASARAPTRVMCEHAGSADRRLLGPPANLLRHLPTNQRLLPPPQLAALRCENGQFGHAGARLHSLSAESPCQGEGAPHPAPPHPTSPRPHALTLPVCPQPLKRLAITESAANDFEWNGKLETSAGSKAVFDIVDLKKLDGGTRAEVEERVLFLAKVKAEPVVRTASRRDAQERVERGLCKTC